LTGPKPTERPRRFYTHVDIVPVDGGYRVRLDGRGAKTPTGAALAVPTEPLARLLAEEWDAQQERVDQAAMPATRLACTAIDCVALARDAMAEEVARYAGSDLLCYRAEEPRALAEREAVLWDPWLAWAATALDLRLQSAMGISPVRQPAEALARMRGLAEAQDDFRLTGLAFAAGLYGSAVLAMAVLRGALSGEDAFELSRLDEAFQQEQWGVDVEAATRTEALRADARLIERWFAALGR